MTKSLANFGMLPKNWVFLRGLAREKGHWGNFPDFFKEQIPGSRVECIDLPGMGEHAGVSSPLTIKGIASFVHEQARRVYPEEPFAVLAMSLGAMVTMDWMKDYEEDISAAVLMNASSKDSPMYLRLRYQVWPSLLKAIAIAQPRERERHIIDLLINSETAKENAFAVWGRIEQDHPTSPATFARQLLAASQFKSPPRKPKAPVLLLCSLGDRFVDPSCSESLHQKYQWQLERHPWAGHDLTWDDPQWTTDYIRRFFT